MGAEKEWYIFKFTPPVPGKIERLDGTAKWFVTGYNNGGAVNAQFDGTPKAGQVTWDGKAPAHVQYIVLDPPKAPWYKDATQHARVDALQFTIVTAETRGISSLGNAAIRCTKFVHSDYGLVYASFTGGAPEYATNPVCNSFRLTSFMVKSRGPVVNCYDCAGAVMLMSNILGCSQQYQYMEPFGYLATTHLIGVIGSCNNPFYPDAPNAPIPYALDAFRKAKIDDDALIGTRVFGNHAFTIFNSKVFDACAGPHLGSELLPAYVNNAVDTSTIPEKNQNAGWTVTPCNVHVIK
jgi:hypothetical protein